MAEDKLWFSHSIEGLFTRGLGEQLTPALRAKLSARGIDLSNLKPAYRIDDVREACRELLPLLWPELSESDAFHRLGVGFMKGYSQTLLGSAMVQMMKLIGPRRTLDRMQKNFRTGGNYMETRVTSQGPTTVELWLNDVSDMPSLYVGIIEEGGRMTGAKNLRCTPKADVAPALTMLVAWDE